MASIIFRNLFSGPFKPNFNKLRVTVSFWRAEDEINMVTQMDKMVKCLISNKVSIIGGGKVGLACAFSLLTLNVTDEIALTDSDATKLKGEVLDLQHGSAFSPEVTITGDGDFSITKDSRICVIAVETSQQNAENINILIEYNINKLHDIIPKILKYSEDPILVIASNPVDILAYATWKISGLPLNSIIGTGTSLDTARLKYLISEKLGINAQSVHIWIIGEHGEASVPVWSNLQIGGVKLEHLIHPSKINNKENLNELHSSVINSSFEIKQIKGYTSWGTAVNVAEICKTILHNTRQLHAVSTLVKGFHGVKDEVFLSLPCVLSRHGISHVVPLILRDKETNDFLNSAIKMYQKQSQIKI